MKIVVTKDNATIDKDELYHAGGSQGLLGFMGLKDCSISSSLVGGSAFGIEQHRY